MTFYSQFEEDQILARVFPDKTGLCVEVGANDGEHGSTTLYFEQHGWHCVLVEPNPFLCRLLRERRPTARLFECGAADHEGAAILNIAEGAAHADGVSVIGDPVSAERRISTFGFQSRPVEVSLRTLDSIFAEAALQRPIDFMSIDVEGLELAVLKGCDLSRWAPRILIIEDNSNFRDHTLRDYLAARDYVPIRRTGVNDWYVRTSDPLVNDDSLAAYAAAKRTARLKECWGLVKRGAARIPGVLFLRQALRRRIRESDRPCS
jgi:FkbM family methyltransferase